MPKMRADPRIYRIARRLDHVEEIGRQRRAEPGEAAHVIEPDQRQNDRAGEQHEGLEEVGIDDRFQAAGDGVDAGRDYQQDRRREVIPAEHRAHQNRAGEEVHRDLREDIGDQRDDGQIPAAFRIEAPLQKLRHREDFRLQVIRHEEPAENEQAEAGGPFVTAHGQSAGCARTGETDEVLARNVGGKQRCADREPADAVAGEEVFAGGALAARMINADSEDDQEIGDDDQVIEHSRSRGY